MKTYIQNVVSDFIWTTMIYLFIYLQTWEPPLGLIQIGGGKFLGSKLVYYLHTEIFVGHVVWKGDLEDIDFSHPKWLTFFIFLDFSNKLFPNIPFEMWALQRI
jgi:hypothetical protein